MESAPPSYQEAVSKEYLPLIGPHLSTASLLSAVRVSSKWNCLLIAYLWGNPSAHLPVDGIHIDHTLGLFNSIFCARNETRMLVHTIQVPSQFPTSSFESTWLRKLLEALPSLQSLVMSSVHIADHLALTAVGSLNAAVPGRRITAVNLQLFNATDCHNITSSSLCNLLKSLPNLMSLDLSGTYAAGKQDFLQRIECLTQLKILSLQRVRLDDQTAATLARSLKYRVRSLNVCKNRLTDRGLQIILKSCLKQDLTSSFNSENPPSYTPMPAGPLGIRQHFGPITLAMLENDCFEERVATILTSGFASRLILDDADDIGITHLRISDNFLTQASVSTLFPVSQLRLLDLGILEQDHNHGKSPTFDASNLLNCSTNLTYLRICHDIFLNSLSSLRPHLQSMPRLSTLVLTNVPLMSATSSVADMIIALIQEIARSTYDAQSRVQKDDHRPSGQQTRPRIWHSKTSSMFALQVLILETAPAVRGIPSDNTQQSITEDLDGENLWRHAANDFSFFREPEPEETPYVQEERTATKMRRSREASEISSDRAYDVISKVAAFRKDCRERHEKAVRNGDLTQHIDGFWHGEIKIVRT